MRTRRRVVVRRRLLPHRLRHHRATRWIVIALVVIVPFTIVQRATAAASRERHRWGDTRQVAVARHRISIGDTIDGDAVRTESWPAALVPDGAIDSVPAGRTALATIEQGEAVLSARVAPDGAHGTAALIPPGWRALAVPVAPTVIALGVGDQVDLIAGFDVGGASADRAPSLVVARDAIVVAVDDQRVTVAVPQEDAERVAFAIVAGTVVPALRTSALR